MFEVKDFVLLILGVVLGIPAAIYVNRLQRPVGQVIAFARRSQSVFTRHGANFVSGEVALTYQDRKIPRLCVSAITLWNAGDETVTAEAVSTVDPLRISLSGEGEIIQAFVERDPWPACAISIQMTEDRSFASLTFEYLNPKQGCVIRVLHTAEEPTIEFTGSLKGANLIRGEDLLAQKTRYVVLARIAILVGGMAAVLGFVTKIRSFANPAWVFLALMLIFPVLAAYAMGAVDKKFKVLPKELAAPEAENFENVLYRAHD